MNLSGTLLAQKNSDGSSLLFSYNDAGDPVGFTRRVNGTAYNYYYITNLQGDVIQILDGNYDTVCNYYYDAWGAIRLITDADGNDITDSENPYSIAYINPIRYRGYYYDVETGFYYLQTRYYDPEIGRFISRDSYENLGVNNDVGSYNLFAYCSNNPVGRADNEGYFWETAFDVISLVGSIADVCKNPHDAWAWAGLVGDIVDLTPFVTGVGETVKIAKTSNRIINGLGNLSKAKEYGLQAYNKLSRLLSGTGLQAHHIIEQRLVKHLKIDVKNMLSVAVTPAEHQVFTNAWRDIFAYGKTDYKGLKIPEIWEAAKKVYKDYPDLLEAARKILFD